MRPAVTFVVFSYKQERFIEQAVRAALAQDYGPLKILVSDDCSPDRTFEIAQRIASEYRGPHEVCVAQTPRNLGLMAHVHRVVETVETDWMVWAAGDDVSLPHRVSRVMDALERYPKAEVIHSGVQVIDEHGAPIPGTLRSRFGWLMRSHVAPLPDQRARLMAFMVAHTGIPIGAAGAWKRSVWTRFPRARDGCTEDVVGGFRAAIGGGAMFIREPLVLYRTHTSNMWSAAGEAQAVRGSEIYERRLGLLRTSLDQHLADLNEAESQGRIPAELAGQLREILAVKRVVEECREGASPAVAGVIAGMMANVYFDIRGRTPSRKRAFQRIRGWTLLATKLAVQEAIRRDLGLRSR